MDEMTRYETARQCAQKFNPPSSEEIASKMSNELTYLLVGQGIMSEISQMVSGELSRMLCGQGLAIDIAEAVAKSQKAGVPDDAVCLFKDGDKWCAVFGDFKDLATSPAGFGENTDEAIADLGNHITPTTLISLNGIDQR